MARALGIGGVFYKCADKKKTGAWYREVLGLEIDEMGGSMFRHAEAASTFGDAAYTVWGPFKADTTYFEPSDSTFMINFIVDDLDGILEKARMAGATLAGEPEAHEYGRFAWLIDPDGVKIELWQPPTTDRAA